MNGIEAFSTDTVSPPLPRVWLWHEADAHRSAHNMARDEALLRLTSRPVLRLYRWQVPSLSFGCFVPWKEATAACHGKSREMIRRWTGGGVVPHGDETDWTYSLILPRHEPLARATISESYRTIHLALVRALQLGGVPATLAAAPAPGLGGLCFAAPVAYDVMAGGRKIAGAAQRRTRHGLLHQGSVQLPALRKSAAIALAHALAAEVSEVTHASDIEPALADLPSLAKRLVQEKYGTTAWLHTPA